MSNPGLIPCTSGLPAWFPTLPTQSAPACGMHVSLGAGQVPIVLGLAAAPVPGSDPLQELTWVTVYSPGPGPLRTSHRVKAVTHFSLTVSLRVFSHFFTMCEQEQCSGWLISASILPSSSGNELLRTAWPRLTSCVVSLHPVSTLTPLHLFSAHCH